MTRSPVSFGAMLLLWLALLASAPQTCSAQVAAPPAGDPSADSSAGTPNAAALKNGTRAASPAKKQPAAPIDAGGVTTAPAEKAQGGIAPILNDVGLGLAALASIGTLIFAVLAWRGTNKLQGRADQAEQQVLETFRKLVTQIPTSVSTDMRVTLKTLSTDLERFSLDMTHAATQAIRTAVAQSQVTAPGNALVPPDRREGASPSGATVDLTNRLDYIAQANRDILSVVQSLRPQPVTQPPPQPAPQAPSLSALIGQVADPSDALAKSGQRLQATFQKLATGSRAGGPSLTAAREAFSLTASPRPSSSRYRCRLLPRTSRKRR